MLSEPTLALLRQMARGVAAQFGSSCEVVIHDLTAGDLEHTVVHIENGHVSGRKPGDGPSKVVLDLLQAGAVAPEDRLAYLTRTPDGKVLRSSSLFIAGPDGQPGAVFAINYDISALVSVEQALHALTDPPGGGDAPPQPITSSVNELLEELIRQSVALVGKPVAFMDREDKRRAVRFLSDSGALLITKAGDKIAAAFGISKFTLYNYLDDSKG
ncbi:MAG TPA: helix-turn-helix transcriptional regulator [Candidatus Intestinimonas stercorigallinarum]|nr:helix-turn-helix transcriptional regulator [Candidatus Intestinimonas stercorigallinarum]